MMISRYLGLRILQSKTPHHTRQGNYTMSTSAGKKFLNENGRVLGKISDKITLLFAITARFP
jgi:hypothetical protein